MAIDLSVDKKEINRIYAVDLLVYKFYKTSLFDFCKRYSYDTFFLEIIRQITDYPSYDSMGNIEVHLSDEFDDKYYALEDRYSYGKDNRGVIERVISLGVNWVVEDVIVHKSSSVFILTGCDNERDLLVKPVTNTPDIRYVGEGESFYVEVCADFTGFMKRNKRYDIRKLKYYKLEDLKLIEHTNTLLLFIDVRDKKYYHLPFKVKSGGCFDKYLANTVTFEFPEDAELKDLMRLFEFCKTCQPDPSLYSNFNVEKVEKKEQKEIIDQYDTDEYWEYLFNNIPSYIREVTEEEFLHYNEEREYPDAPDYTRDDNFETKIKELDFVPDNLGLSTKEDEVVYATEKELSEILRSTWVDDDEFDPFSTPFKGL